MKSNNVISFLSLFLLYFSLSLNAEPMRFTQYYAIETNVSDDKELFEVLEQVHEFLKNNLIECTGDFNKTTTLTKFVRVNAKKW